MAPSTGRPRPDTEVVFDPGTYTSGVPFEALARLRRQAPVAWVPRSRSWAGRQARGSGWCCGTRTRIGAGQAAVVLFLTGSHADP
jgi:hypothetical protein